MRRKFTIIEIAVGAALAGGFAGAVSLFLPIPTQIQAGVTDQASWTQTPTGPTNNGRTNSDQSPNRQPPNRQSPNSPSGEGETRRIKAQASFEGRVIKVSDGDTITVRSGTENIKVRLADIDAPEKDQPWGQKSREELGRLVAGKDVSIFSQTTDRYGRTVGHVEVSGKNINREMVARGAAWAYRQYVRDPTMIDLETRAKLNRQGLWAMDETQRMPPWEYRAQRRDGVIAGR
jgi:micrococcal nuclease